jgi:hypothetical protein
MHINNLESHLDDKLLENLINNNKPMLFEEAGRYMVKNN